MNQQQMMRLKKMQKQMMEAQEKLENSVFLHFYKEMSFFEHRNFNRLLLSP